ncbi:MAG: hypothetical protein KDB00_20830, partial [Planctomycetales bacterium]|nr:hypothetical protein [Planctomycetales bacterium]
MLLRTPRLERLETRHLLAAMDMLHNVHVTDEAILTAHDTVPRMIGADVVALQDGRWSDADTWGGQLPESNDNVRILEGIDVVFDADATIANLEVFGSLSFAPDVDTSLRLRTIYVMPVGELTIGSEVSPIVASSEIVFLDGPIDEGKDPFQFGVGLINFGAFRTDGRDVTPHVRAGSNIDAGDISVVIENLPSDWRIGDEILLPETSQARLGSESETAIIAGIDGNIVTLESPVTYDHHGVSENPFQVEVFAHIANLTRNVTLRSENPSGVRGHFLSTGHTDVSIEDAAFVGMGRTTAEALDNTIVDADGDIIHIGTNEEARYSIHAHHVMGQFDVKNSVVKDGLKWGIAIHGTSNVNVLDNVVYDVDGSGIITENGLETDNSLIGNLVVKVDGPGGRGSRGNSDRGNGGSGFWFQSPNGTVEHNAVYDAANFGFTFNGYGHKRTDANFQLRQFDSFKGNEVASSFGGIWLTWSQGQFDLANYQSMAFEDTLIWHIGSAGVESYHEANYSFRQLIIIGDPSEANSILASPSSVEARTTKGVDLNFGVYENWNLVFEDLKIAGVNVGFITSRNAGESGTVVRDAIIEAYINVDIPRSAELDDLKVERVSFLPSRTVRITQAMPEEVANVWLEGIGTVEPGQLGDTTGLTDGRRRVVDSRVQLRSDGELRVTGGDGQDVIVIDKVGHEIVVNINNDSFRFDFLSTRSIVVIGNAGDDHITNNVSDISKVLIYGNDGDDVLIGSDGRESLNGGSGNDTIDGGAGDDVIGGGLGSDTLIGGLGQDKIRGGDGIDQILADEI